MRIFWRILVALVLVAAILGLGAYAYNLGVTQGLAQKVQLPAGGTAPLPYIHFGYPFFGFGFGLLSCLVPLFLLCLVFGSLRALFWRGPMGWRHMYGRRWDWRNGENKGVPPFFEEWHRRAHGEPEPTEEKK